MQWRILEKARNRKTGARVSPSSPRLLTTSPVCPDFNRQLEPESWRDTGIEEEQQVGADNVDPALQAELDAWDAASDEALEGVENSLPE